MTVTRRHKVNPLKIMCILLYGEHEFVRWEGSTTTIMNGPMARHVRVPNSRLREYLRWLEAAGYITELDMTYGSSTFQVVPPPALERANGN